MNDDAARETWITSDPDGRLRIVTPADQAAAVEREISENWRDVADAGDFEHLVAWVVGVGERHGWPLDEDWVRHTFADLVSAT